MPDARPEQPTTRLVAALRIPRNAKIGFTAGCLIAAGAYAFRIVGVAGPVSGTRGTPVLFFLLAIVLAVTSGVFITIVLTARSALQLARENDT